MDRKTEERFDEIDNTLNRNFGWIISTRTKR